MIERRMKNRRQSDRRILRSFEQLREFIAETERERAEWTKAAGELGLGPWEPHEDFGTWLRRELNAWIARQPIAQQLVNPETGETIAEPNPCPHLSCDGNCNPCERGAAPLPGAAREE